MSTNQPSIEDRLRAARAELEAAEAAELEAFNAVSVAREQHALGEISRRDLLARQRDLSDAQEGVEGLRAKIRALDRLQVQQSDAATAAATRARAEREAAERRAAADVEAAIATRVAAIADELDHLAAESRSSITGWAPATHANRARAFESAIQGVASLARVYPQSN